MKKQFRISNGNMIVLMLSVMLIAMIFPAAVFANDTDPDPCEEESAATEGEVFTLNMSEFLEEAEEEEMMMICPIVAPNAGPCGPDPFILNTYTCATYQWTVTGDGQIVVGTTTSPSIQVQGFGFQGSFTVSLVATSCLGPFQNISCSRTWSWTVQDCL